MKFKNLAVIAASLALAVTANSQNISSSFVNLDFDATLANSFPTGFDTPGNDVPGWQNYGTIVDAGVENSAAWWGTYEQYASFANAGGGAYNLSSYIIQSGDKFTIDFQAQWWGWTGANGQWTATLFYDNPANVIGSYTTPNLNGGPGAWTAYSTSVPIDATVGSVGGQLGIIMANTGTGIAQMDEISISVVAVPEPTAMSLLAVAGLGMLLGRRRLVKS